jgi:hypothetical protein
VDEWGSILWVKWLFVSDAFIELWDRFLAVDQKYKPVVILALLLCLALLQFIWSFGKIQAPDGDTSKDTAPIRTPARPDFTAPPAVWLEYYLRRHYLGVVRGKGIGWFSPWLLLWVASAGAIGCIIFSIFELLGLPFIEKHYYLIAFVCSLSIAILVAYAHNAGRRHGARQPPVKVRTFVDVFAKPIALTVLFVGITLYKPSPLAAYKVIVGSGIFG